MKRSNLAPDDLRVGMYVVIAAEEKLAPWDYDAIISRQHEPRPKVGVGLKILSINLPFVVVEAPPVREMYGATVQSVFPLDVRTVTLARASKRYAAAWKNSPAAYEAKIGGLSKARDKLHERWVQQYIRYERLLITLKNMVGLGGSPSEEEIVATLAQAIRQRQEQRP